MPAAAKYLAGYAEAEASQAGTLPLTNYEQVLVIPAHRESPDHLERVWRNLPPDALIIIVVNSTDEDDRETQALLNQLRPANDSASLTLQNPGPAAPALLIVDRCTSGRTLPRRQGVGLARKIGADIALALIDAGVVDSPMIHNTDADVTLPADYFSPHCNAGALLYPFRHAAESALTTAACLYEISMFYYVAGLRWARSPYAFTTVGSTIAVHANDYAVVRGFPKRRAGEDFYLLNKLAKTGPIHQLEAPVVDIAARASDRVPFGTGTSLGRIGALADPSAEFRFYHPAIFEQLATWQSRLATLRPGERLADQGLSAPLQSWCAACGFDRLLERRQHEFRDQRTFTRFVHEWFDGFRTLKLIHHLRDEHYPSVGIDAIAETAFTPPLKELDDFRHRLADICFDGGRYGLASLPAFKG